MRGFRRNNFRQFQINANIPFAGVPILTAPLNGGTPAAPMSGGPQAQATPVVDSNNHPSKMNPGQPSTSPNDRVTQPDHPSNQGGQSPLDKFVKLFDNSPKLDDKGNPVTPAKTILDAGLADYRTAAQKINFTDGIKPESLAAISEGGEKAQQALTEILGIFGQNLFAHAASTATRVTKQGLELGQSSIDDRINTLVTLKGASSSIKGNPEVLNHPAVKPMVDAVQQQLLKMNPNLNETQLAEQTMEYFGAFGKLTDSPPADANNGSKPQFNFLDFLTK